MDKITFYAESYGCSSNTFDFQVILGILAEHGFQRVNNICEAELIILNTCVVKKATEDRMLSRIVGLSKTGKPLIISGCLPRIALNKLVKAAPNFAAVLDPYSVERIIEAAFAAAKGSKGLVYFSNGNETPHGKLLRKRVRLNPFIDVIQVAEGCLGCCSYCCTRFARGRLHSYPSTLILKEISRSVKEGVVEIRLSSQDLGAYGLDIGTDLTELLGEVKKVQGEFKVRLGMLNPQHALRMIDGLVEALRHPKFFKFIHIPVESGSDKILSDMRRPYSRADFKKLVEKLRSLVPDVTIATDVIVGFPTETDEDFKDTLSLIQETSPDIVHVSKYHHRPKTHASMTWEELDPRTVAERARVLSEICGNISFKSNLRLVGREVNAYILDVGPKGGLLGRIDNYKKVVLEGGSNMVRLGSNVRLKIVKANPRYLTANLIK
ncbi:MAG: tRNA (N(6)-L-threonylcarbamoyladenosine(37)-C(2))-methylthiotransferase [Candidatus Bathyarchaeia archaeon]|nr:tRNA (N(6)-L-threonylcarbamoyladenosine(37)-C(2))-methylthiotransferase [Candidatus Bathyarchaeota archaeon]